MKLISIFGLASVALWCVGAEAQPTGGDKLPEIIEARKVINATGGTCDDVARLLELAKSVKTPSARIAYEQASQARRKAGFAPAAGAYESIRKYSQDSWWALGDRDDGTHSDDLTPDEAVDAARATLEAAWCYLGAEKQSELAKMIADLEPIRVRFAGLRAKETKCRKTAACKTKRLALRNSQELCSLYDQRDLFEQIAAEEKRNPSGVIDLARLHDAGAGIQQVNEQIMEAKAAYLAKVKAPFNRAICKDLPVDKETGDYVRPPEIVTLEP